MPLILASLLFAVSLSLLPYTPPPPDSEEEEERIQQLYLKANDDQNSSSPLLPLAYTPRLKLHIETCSSALSYSPPSTISTPPRASYPNEIDHPHSPTSSPQRALSFSHIHLPTNPPQSPPNMSHAPASSSTITPCSSAPSSPRFNPLHSHSHGIVCLDSPRLVRGDDKERIFEHDVKGQSVRESTVSDQGLGFVVNKSLSHFERPRCMSLPF